MIPEVVLPPEGLAADVARVGPLVGVGPLVDEEVVRLGELPVAELADELLFGPGGTAGRPQESTVDGPRSGRKQGRARGREREGRGGTRGKERVPGARGRRRR